jgi:hypothetical protein
MEPEEILSSTDPKIAEMVERVLEIERDYQYHQNLDENKGLVKEITDKIARLFDQGAAIG